MMLIRTQKAKVTKANKKPIIFLFNFVYTVFVSGFTPLDPDPNPFPYLPKNEWIPVLFYLLTVNTEPPLRIPFENTVWFGFHPAGIEPRTIPCPGLLKTGSVPLLLTFFLISWFPEFFFYKILFYAINLRSKDRPNECCGDLLCGSCSESPYFGCWGFYSGYGYIRYCRYCTNRKCL